MYHIIYSIIVRMKGCELVKIDLHCHTVIADDAFADTQTQIVRMPKKKAVCSDAPNETVKKPGVRKANYDEYKAMDSRERAEITFLDLGGCDFRTMDFINICRDAENLTWVELSNTIIDPRCMVYCMDDHRSLLSSGAFTDDNGIICWPGKGNTPSHAYENRRPEMKTFQEATDRERRAYLGLNEQARIRIVWHKDRSPSPTSSSSVFSDRPEQSGRSKGGSVKPSMLWTLEDEYMTGGWMDDEE